MEGHVTDEERFLKPGRSTTDTSTPLRDLYLADLERLEESIWRNEEIGEKRFDFFVTFATAVVGGLVVLWTSDRSASATSRVLSRSINVALLALLVFGLVSYRRMMHCDSITDEYKRDTKMIRRRYRELFQAECPEIKDYRLESEDRAEESDLAHRWRRIKHMGYTQTLAIVNGVLLAIVLMWAGVVTELAALSGVAFGAVLCFHGARPHKSHRVIHKSHQVK
jgi:hypothetical protein